MNGDQLYDCHDFLGKLLGKLAQWKPLAHFMTICFMTVAVA